MKSKTIKIIIEAMMRKWLATIPDETLRKDVREGAIITGGSIVSLLLNEEPNDYDIYFKTQDLARRVAQHYVNRFMEKPPKAFLDSDGKIGKTITIRDCNGGVKLYIKSAGAVGENSENYQYFEGEEDTAGTAFVEAITKTEETNVQVKTEEVKDHRPIFMSENAMSLAGKIQLIFRFCGTPDEIHKNYDFVHCTNYYDCGEKKLTLHAKALECIMAKELIYQGSLYPICSLFRLRKFIKRGWTITAGQILKMAMQVSKLDLTDVNVLNEQLIGVDAAYFRHMVELLQEKDPTKVDEAYLLNLIDAIQ